MKFVTYDLSREAGNKFTNEIDIYLTFEQFLRISYDILDSQSLIKAIQKDKMDAQAKGSQYPQQRILTQGGTSAESLAQKGKSRPDGMSESRVLKIFAGNKLPIMFQAEKGPGETDSKGLIIPRYGFKPEQKVMMGLSADDAKELFLITREEIRAFIVAKRMMEMMNPPAPTQGTQNNYQPQKQQAPASTYQAPTQSQPAPAYQAPAQQKPQYQQQNSFDNAMNPPQPPVAPLKEDNFPIDDELFGGADDFFS